MNESGRHPVNVGHLVMGLAFLGLLAVWALMVSDAVAGEELRWLMPVPWILAGAAGLLASVLAGRRRSRDDATPEPAAPVPTTPTTTAAPSTDTEQEIR